MKPRTKQQQLVYGLSVQLPQLHKKLESWAFEDCIKHIGYRTKTATSCLSCGQRWKGHVNRKSEICPGCKRKLRIEDTRKKKYSQMVYFAVLDVVGDFQVNRYFQMYSYHKVGTQPRTFCWEVVQQWMQPDGKHEVVARNRGGMGHYMSHNFHGELEIRDRNLIRNKYNLYPTAVFPKIRCLPIYKRNGFKGKIGDSTPYEIFTHIISDNKAETLLKTAQYSLLNARIEGSGVGSFWSSIKICIRNNYIVKDARIWLDYLQLLSYFGKDIRSSKYVCPQNLARAHDRLVIKKREVEKRLDIERKRRRAEADQQAYLESKHAYFGLVFSKGNLTIKVLESVKEFMEEGDIHKHCVFTNEYYKKEDSLVFSARVDGKPVETIEVSLSEMKILQSRGLSNQASEYHQQIIDLINKNLHVIKKRRRELKKAAA